jgi:glucosamine--fructose-6-phosphate aminotransferase (isomerizing)
VCGIFGVALSTESNFDRSSIELLMDNLFRLSESRGKEASGVAVNTPEAILVAKYAIPASEMIRRDEYRQLYHQASSENGRRTNGNTHYPTCIIGHSRLVTNGGQQVHANNQPAIASGMVAIHNGIITNVDDLWERFDELERDTDLDTEIVLDLIRHFYHESEDLIASVQRTFSLIEGVASLAILFEDIQAIMLATNNGSLYVARPPDNQGFIFASERYILDQLTRKNGLQNKLSGFEIQHVEPGTGFVLSLDTLEGEMFDLEPAGESGTVPLNRLDRPKPIQDVSPESELGTAPERIPGEGPYILSPSFVDEYPRNRDAIAHLRRCTRCVMPETMPFIEFDDEGVCNYCRIYKKMDHLGVEALEEAVAPYRKSNGEPDCLITFSGGRDSSYTVHFMTKVLKMNPVTYTYDWGMVTDLARRNQMRLCGELGLEHILVSANLARKRANIRKNVSAWLRKPDLGLVPLFMAGDKQYFYHANQVARHTGVELIILGENLLETTLFKSGFCGIAPNPDSEHTYTLSLWNKAKLAWYYGSRYITNPGYINQSLIDTVGAYMSYYVIPHNYLNMYQYIRWDEETIASSLISEYNWETATDTQNTWRIGDGTASFYNYIYYTMGGFSENDTFRSNQIREGMLTREEAIRHVEEDNQPRYESMQWYCDIIGIDFYDAVERINAAPKLYPQI